MQSFTTLTAVAAVLLRGNVDTDTIIPSREIRKVAKTGLAEGLFAPWRYLPGTNREPDPSFVLNDAAYAGAQILLCGSNFGCGSSREYAVWALLEYGFRALVAPSFNPIFQRNCARNGVLAAVVEDQRLHAIASWVSKDPQQNRVSVDLGAQEITGGGQKLAFTIGARDRQDLLEGLDEIDRTLQLQSRIKAFRDRDALARPWIYEDERGSRQTAPPPA
jgi:3-isopropylmalate/(R)-2-methylmalate dehydratase small subunit